MCRSCTWWPVCSGSHTYTSATAHASAAAAAVQPSHPGQSKSNEHCSKHQQVCIQGARQGRQRKNKDACPQGPTCNKGRTWRCKSSLPPLSSSLIRVLGIGFGCGIGFVVLLLLLLLVGQWKGEGTQYVGLGSAEVSWAGLGWAGLGWGERALAELLVRVVVEESECVSSGGKSSIAASIFAVHSSGRGVWARAEDLFKWVNICVLWRCD